MGQDWIDFEKFSWSLVCSYMIIVVEMHKNADWFKPIHRNNRTKDWMHDKQWSLFKEYPNSGAEKKNEEIISSSCLPHHKRASSFTNKHEAARLHLLPMLSRYRRMSESVQHDEQCSSLHDRWCFRYDEQCSSFHAEGLINSDIKLVSYSSSCI